MLSGQPWCVARRADEVEPILAPPPSVPRSPRRTIATAQLLYHRFHLFFALRDFPSYHEPVLATLYVSSKLHDTLKKPREIVLASYGVRYPDLLGGKVTLSDADVDVAVRVFSRRPLLGLSARFGGPTRQGADQRFAVPATAHPQTLEADRLKVLAIERLVLETVCFNFSVQTPFEYVLKCGKALGGASLCLPCGQRRRARH